MDSNLMTDVSHLRSLVEQFAGLRVLVLGDLMLDTYVFGQVERISPEAPVPVIVAEPGEDRLGGAAAVAHMLACFGAQVRLAGVVGSDAAAHTLLGLLAAAGIDSVMVVPEVARPTSVKTRYIGKAQGRHPQQVLRVDRESRQPLAEQVALCLRDQITSAIATVDILLVSDYGKGVCTPDLLSVLMKAARTEGRRVLVDPARGAALGRYRGAACLTPNRSEAMAATGLSMNGAAEALLAAEHLRSAADAEAAIITLDKDGMVLAHADGRQVHFPTRPRAVYDITGAGDMVLSVLGLALAAGADYPAAITLANLAGGLVVERLGTATLDRTELLRELHSPLTALAKLPALPHLLRTLEGHRTRGQRVVFTNGCFDLLHAGHVDSLQRSRELGDILVVGLNSDASVRRLKGPGRPRQPAAARAAVLAALACVDYVVVFEEDTPANLIHAITPDLLVKGADYQDRPIAGREHVEAHGGRVVLLPLLSGFSTTQLLDTSGKDSDAVIRTILS